MLKDKLISLNEASQLGSRDTLALHRKYLNAGLVSLTGLIKFNKVYKKAEGCIIEDMDGKRYIDFLGGYGALNTGHNHPQVVKSLCEIREKPNILQAGMNPYAAALANNLSVVTDGAMRRSFFCNSGAEAVEGALKLARAASEKSKIIFCKNSFHGKTLGALSVTGREKYRQSFYPLLPDCEQIVYGDIQSLEEKLASKAVAAFIIEPVQGEGGIIVPPVGYLSEARRLCTKYDALLIIDEIQTGLGRTGKMFAYQHENIKPDILCLAKSLGGGIIPIGTYMTTDEIYQRAYGGMEKCLLHTSTFGGNSYACAAALATIEVILSENLAEEAEKKGKYLLKRLQILQSKYEMIKDVRGKGLMLGIEFNSSPSKLLNALSNGVYENMAHEYFASLVAGKLLNEYGILTAYTLNNPNVIRIEPPLTIGYEHIDKLVNSLEKIFEKNKSMLRMAIGSMLK